MTIGIKQSTSDEATSAEQVARLWQRLGDAGNPHDKFVAWLGLQCTALGEVRHAALFDAADESRALRLLALWPQAAAVPDTLATLARRAALERITIATRAPVDGATGDRVPLLNLAVPIESGQKLTAVVVYALVAPLNVDLGRCIAPLEWGNVWLGQMLRLQSNEQGPPTLPARFAQLLATPVQYASFLEAANAFLNELASETGASRASLGLLHRNAVELQAQSHTATLNKRAEITRALALAMEEAVDAGEPVLFDITSEYHLPAHEALARHGMARQIYSIPFERGDDFCGVVTLETQAGEGFSPQPLMLADSATLVTGPLLQLAFADEAPVVKRIAHDLWRALHAIASAGHLVLKASVAAAAVLLAMLALLPLPYRITTDAILEPSIRIAAVAPYDGYIARPLVRAGETVQQGATLVELDAREYRLEQLRWQSEFDRLSRQYRQVLASGTAAEAEIMAAQRDQSAAQLALATDKVDKSVIKAALDGIVVTGDLSKDIGAPVSRGQVLFEVAPLESYRLILNVDEADVDTIQPRQQGALTLAARPGEKLQYTIDKVTPVSEAMDGRNTFRVEASLAQTPAWLQPGMEGVGKIAVGRRSALWIATHDLVDWLRLSLWRWLP